MNYMLLEIYMDKMALRLYVKMTIEKGFIRLMWKILSRDIYQWFFNTQIKTTTTSMLNEATLTLRVANHDEMRSSIHYLYRDNELQ